MQGVAVKKASAGSQGSTETKPKKGKGAAGAILSMSTFQTIFIIGKEEIFKHSPTAAVE